MKKAMNRVSIFLAAFGMTAKAMATYGKMHRVIKQAFPENQVHGDPKQR